MKMRLGQTNRIISLLLLAVMLLTTVPVAVFAAGEEYTPIALDEEAQVELNGVDKTEAIFSFVPAETSHYSFYSSSDHDTFGYILSAEGELITENDDSAYAGGANFCAAAMLTAGTTYLLKARFYSQDRKGSFTVKVEKTKYASSIDISDSDIFTDRVGAFRSFNCVTTPDGTYCGELSWSSSNPEVANVNGTYSNSAQFIFKSPGTTTLTLTTSLGFTVTREITVVDAEDIALDTVTKVSNEKYCTCSYRFTPTETGMYALFNTGDIDTHTMMYLFDDDWVQISANDTYPGGDMYLSCYFLENKTYTITFTFGESNKSADICISKEAKPTGISLDKESYNGKIGEAIKLKVIKNAANERQENITWSSNNEAVATVEGGLVSLIGKGNATVTAVTESGFSASCTFTVDGYETIKRGETKNVTLSRGGYMSYLFTPEVDGTYSFFSMAESSDTNGYILTQDGEELANDDNSGTNDNFDVKYEMTAGTSYLLKAKYWYNYTSGSFDVRVVLLNNDGSVAHSYTDYEYDNTQHTATCDYCGESIIDGHSFDNKGLCVCGLFHLHNGASFAKDKTYHWGSCPSCNMYVSEGHNYNSENVCIVCGYFKHVCNIDEWNYSEFVHSGLCSICGINVSEDHVYGDDGKCVCGYYVHDHVEEGYGYTYSEHYTTCNLCRIPMNYFLHHYDENGKCVCGREKLNGVCIDNTWLSDGDYLTVDGKLVTSKPSVGYAYLHDNVLVLHNFVYSGKNTDERIYSSLVYTEMDLEIKVEGANSLHCIDGDGIIVSNGSLYLSGNGSLIVIADGDFDGIDVCNDLTIDISVLKITATDHGIEVDDNLTINNGCFYIYAEDDGMDVNDEVVINDGLFYIDAEDYGIDTSSNVLINNGDFYIVTHDENGINADMVVTIEGGYFEFDTYDECISSVYDKVCINGGTFLFDAGSTDYAVEAKTDIIMGNAFTGYTAVDAGYEYYVLADQDGEAIKDGTLRADEDEKLQLMNSWVVFPEEPVTALDGKFSISEIAVTDDNGNALVNGKDYTVYLSPNKFENDRLYCLAVKGIGNYCGTVFTLITIAPCTGDVNGDGAVDNLDAAAILKYDAGITNLNDAQIQAADVNGDGYPDNLDAAMILKYDAGIIDSLTTAN